MRTSFLMFFAATALAAPCAADDQPNYTRYYIHAIGDRTLVVHSCLTPTRFSVKTDEKTVVIRLDGKVGKISDLKVGQWVKFRHEGNRDDPEHHRITMIEVVTDAVTPADEKKPATGTGPTERPPFILGADISWVQQQEDEGVRFTDHGQQKDILALLKDHGFNWIRLRVFHNPKAEKGYSKKGYCDLDHTLAMAKRIKAAGMGFLLDFHYSDTWADPGIRSSLRPGPISTGPNWKRPSTITPETFWRL